MTYRPAAALAARLLLASLLAGLIGLVGSAAVAQDATATVATTTVAGPITPVAADHLAETVDDAAAAGHAALLVTLDTPGGLVTSMQSIVQTFLNAPLPIIVHVAPGGANAGSAGTYITLSAHVAAMAPATRIGAATPIDLEGGEVGDKIVNDAAAFAEAIAEARGRDVDFAVDAVREGRSITATEALEIGAIDLIAEDTTAVLVAADGLEVEVRGATVTLATAGAVTEELEWSWARRLLQAIADPNLAFLFISIGTVAIIYELANPGLGAGGVIGGVLLILAMFSLSVLPVTVAGVALLLLAAVLLVAELFAPGIGVGAGGGTVALLLGGLFLFEPPSGLAVGLTVLVPSVLVVLGLTVLAGVMVGRVRGQPVHGASDDLVGRVASVRVTTTGEPRVRLDGTSWRARPTSGATITDGDTVRVVAVDNLDLVVTPLDPDPASPTAPEPVEERG